MLLTYVDNEAGINLYGGVVGDADKAVNNLLDNNLKYNSEVKCNHHNIKNTAVVNIVVIFTKSNDYIAIKKKGDCTSATITFLPILIIAYIFIKNKTVILNSVVLELLYGFGDGFPTDFKFGRFCNGK